MTALDTIHKHQLIEEKEIESINSRLSTLREDLVEKVPTHFSAKDIVSAFFGALLIGLTFSLKGGTVRAAESLTNFHIIAIIFSTIVILSAEIYFVGYARVKNKKERPAGQFIIKRLITLYIISMLVSLYLVYIFALNYQFPDKYGIFSMVILISMPCAVGSAIPSILKKY